MFEETLELGLFFGALLDGISDSSSANLFRFLSLFPFNSAPDFPRTSLDLDLNFPTISQLIFSFSDGVPSLPVSETDFSLLTSEESLRSTMSLIRSLSSVECLFTSSPFFERSKTLSERSNAAFSRPSLELVLDLLLVGVDGGFFAGARLRTSRTLNLDFLSRLNFEGGGGVSSVSFKRSSLLTLFRSSSGPLAPFPLVTISSLHCLTKSKSCFPILRMH